MEQLTPTLVHRLAAEYPAATDERYSTNIDAGRRGDLSALRLLTTWKNSGSNDEPMDFGNHPQKQKAWEYFAERLNTYLRPDGVQRLRSDFEARTPVWATFWHHVLYGTPIFDRYTRMAFNFFGCGKRIGVNEATITAGKHWTLYDEYTGWYQREHDRLKAEDPTIDERTLDRALFMWGRKEAKRQTAEGAIEWPSDRKCHSSRKAKSFPRAALCGRSLGTEVESDRGWQTRGSRKTSRLEDLWP